jgi:hypothetical protein
MACSLQPLKKGGVSMGKVLSLIFQSLLTQFPQAINILRWRHIFLLLESIAFVSRWRRISRVTSCQVPGIGLTFSAPFRLPALSDPLQTGTFAHARHGLPGFLPGLLNDLRLVGMAPSSCLLFRRPGTLCVYLPFLEVIESFAPVTAPKRSLFG